MSIATSETRMNSFEKACADVQAARQLLRDASRSRPKCEECGGNGRQALDVCKATIYYRFNHNWSGYSYE